MIPKKILITLFTSGLLVIIVFIGLAIYQAFQKTSEKDLAIMKNLNIDAARLEELKEELKKSEEKVLTNPSTVNYLELGRSQEDLSLYDEAISSYQKASQISPRDFLPYSNLGHLYERIGRYEEAEREYQAAIRAAPRNVPLYRDLVDLYRYNLPEKASEIPEILLKALKEIPDSKDFISQLATYYRDFGPLEKAIEYYEKLLQLDPTNQAAQDELAVLKDRLEKK